MATPVENLLTQIQADQAHYLGILHDDFNKLTDHVKQLKSGSTGSQGKGVMNEVASIGKQFKQVAAVVAVVTAALLAIPAALSAITYAALPFVQALSPSTVEAFHRELDGLKATVGEGLIPIVAYATASLREWAGILLPTIRELKPMIDKLASSVSGFMSGFVRTAVAGLSLLLKAIDPLVTSLSGWLDIIGQVLEVSSAVVSVMGSFQEAVDLLTKVLEGPLFGVLDALGLKMKDFQDVVSKSIIGLTFLAASALKLAGMNETLGKFRAQLAKNIEARRNPAGGLTAAPKDAAISGIDSIVAKMNERAFVATSGAPVTRATDDLLTDILKVVDDVSKDNSLKDTIKAAIMEALPGSKTVADVKTVVTTVTDPSATSSDRFKAGRESGGLIGGGIAVGTGLAGDALDALNPFNW